MDKNERILAEIEARIKNARAELDNISPTLAPLLEYYDGQSSSGLAHEMMQSISASLAMWSEYEIQGGGFEWYYDGSDQPHALGYIYESITKQPDLSDKTPIGSNTAEARDDFDGRVEFGNMIHADIGGFDIGQACFPVYDIDISQLGGDEEYDTREQFVNLYTLRLYKCLHLVFRHLAATGFMESMNLIKPTCFFANNHDWSPFLIFIYEDHKHYDSLTEAGPTRVPHLQTWIDDIKTAAAEKEKRENFIYKILTEPPQQLEANLLSMPVLSDSEGNKIDCNQEELRSFGWTQLSDPDNYSQISVDAFYHYLQYALTYHEPDTYLLQTPLTCLFVRDSLKAFEIVKKIITEQPELKETIKKSIGNYLRWASKNYIERRSPNPTLALHNSPDAIESMQRILELDD